MELVQWKATKSEYKSYKKVTLFYFRAFSPLSKRGCNPAAIEWVHSVLALLVKSRDIVVLASIILSKIERLARHWPKSWVDMPSIRTVLHRQFGNNL